MPRIKILENNSRVNTVKKRIDLIQRHTTTNLSPRWNMSPIESLPTLNLLTRRSMTCLAITGAWAHWSYGAEKSRFSKKIGKRLSSAIWVVFHHCSTCSGYENLRFWQPASLEIHDFASVNYQIRQWFLLSKSSNHTHYNLMPMLNHDIDLIRSLETSHRSLPTSNLPTLRSKVASVSDLASKNYNA